MAFPRLASIAELAWSPKGHSDWRRFRERLAGFGRRLDALGLAFTRADGVDWH